MNARIGLRNGSAQLLRSLPPLRGKQRLGLHLQDLLSDYSHTNQCIQTIRMADGFLMKIDLRSRMERGVFWTGRYDADIPRKLAACVPDNAVVLDVGANIGFYAIALATALRERGVSIRCFEPAKRNFERLQENIRINDLQDVVAAFRVALGDSEGFVELAGETDHAAATGNAVIARTLPACAGDSACRLTTLDQFAAEHGLQRCDMIKVDIEGWDYAFLRGGLACLSRFKPLIFLELNSILMDQCGWGVHALRELADSLQYRLLYLRKETIVPAPPPAPYVINALLVRDDTEAARLHDLFH